MCLALLNDGKLVSGSYDKTIRIWDTKRNYECVKTYEETEGVYSLLFTKKKDKLILGLDDGSIKIYR